MENIVSNLTQVPKVNMKISYYIQIFFYTGIPTLLGIASLVTFLQNTPATAQIAPAANDTNTTVKQTTDNTFDITGGTKAGENLFHSFEKFGLTEGQTANFISNPSIQNILTRVTGGDASFINGIIQITGGKSNLYFMNPAGILFGANATLDLPGAFTATTANGIGFGNNKWFNAIGNNDYAALVGNPTEFAFTMKQPGAIVNNGRIYSIGDISLIGGTVLSSGEIISENGQIAIATVPGQQVVRISQPGQILNFEIQPLLANQISPTNWNLPILSLPQLLTGGQAENASSVTVDGDKVTLTGSGVEIKDGDVVTNYVDANNVKISASGNQISMEKQVDVIDILPSISDLVQSFPDIILDIPSEDIIPLTPLTPPPPPQVTPPVEPILGDINSIPPNQPTEKSDTAIISVNTPPMGPIVPEVPPTTPKTAPEPVNTPRTASEPENNQVPPSNQPQVVAQESLRTRTPISTVSSNALTAVQSENSLKASTNRPQQQIITLSSNYKLIEARQNLQRALNFYEQKNDIPRKIITLVYLGSVSLYLHDYQQASLYSQNLLTLARQQNNPQAEAQALVKLGISDKGLGRYNQALNNYQQALSIARQIKSPTIEMQALGNLGNVYETLGDYDNAITTYEQSINLARQLKSERVEAITLGNLGAVYTNLANYDKALTIFQQSLKISKKLANPSLQTSILINLGTTYHSQNQVENARSYYQQALALAKTTNDKRREAEALANLGLVYVDLRNYPTAIKYYEQSLVIAYKINDPALLGSAFNNLGHALFRAGKLNDAEQKVRAAINIFDNLRPGLTDTYKVSIFDTQLFSYSLLQQILVAANKTELALEASEKGRARAFSELLAQRLYDKNNKKAEVSFPNIDKIRQIAREQNATLVEYSIMNDEDFKSRGKQKGREQDLFIWVVTPAGKVTFRQVSLKKFWNKNATLTDIIRINRCLILNPVADCSELADKLRTFKVQNTSTPNKSSKSQDYRQILHQLLIEPIADLLPTNPEDNVIFIPHEQLFLVPFPALQDKDGKYLIEKHAIRTAPSVQILDLTRALKNKRKQQNQNSSILNSQSKVLVVGNPIMPKVSLTLGQRSEELSELPEAEREALAIAKILNTNPLVRENATKADILNKIPNARLIHLATHGLLEYNTPNGKVSLQGLGIPGAIALAPSNNDDGLLTANEIINLRLNAELVVLSACDTGQGRISGDGVIGLSRSFISAGTQSVVVSLWAVGDAQTAKLMKNFYQTLEKNPNKASALRQAMLMTMKEESQPLYWAAFTLIGES